VISITQTYVHLDSFSKPAYRVCRVVEDLVLPFSPVEKGFFLGARGEEAGRRLPSPWLTTISN
jgi:hypothetical protein